MAVDGENHAHAFGSAHPRARSWLRRAALASGRRRDGRHSRRATGALRRPRCNARGNPALMLHHVGNTRWDTLLQQSLQHALVALRAERPGRLAARLLSPSACRQAVAERERAWGWAHMRHVSCPSVAGERAALGAARARRRRLVRLGRAGSAGRPGARCVANAFITPGARCVATYRVLQMARAHLKHCN